MRFIVGAHVSRILHRAGACRRIEHLHGGGVHTARAGREVILYAGTVKSPQILQLSGIGPAQDLRRQEVSVVVDLPGVGANLQDHVRVPIMFRVARRRYTFACPFGRQPALFASTPRFTGVRRGRRSCDRAHRCERGGPGSSSRVHLARDAGTARHARGIRDWLDRAAQPRPRPASFSGPFEGTADRSQLFCGSERSDPNGDRNRVGTPDRADLGVSVRRALTQSFYPPIGRWRSISGNMPPLSYHPVGTCRMGSGRDGRRRS